MSEHDEVFAELAAQSRTALYKALEETKELVLLCFGAVSVYTKPYYCRHLKLIASAMEAPGEDSEYFKDTTNLLNAVFKSEAISMPANIKER